MLSLFRPSSKVVKEGRILTKFKQLQRQSAGVFCMAPGFLQNGVF
jgi:hypothetical protein